MQNAQLFSRAAEAMIAATNSLGRTARLAVLFACSQLFTFDGRCRAEPVVPGSGLRIAQVGDDFEDPRWVWHHNWPKSSSDLNKSQNEPGGESGNGRWYEGIKRGHPDLIRRVNTPAGGLPGSRGSLLLRSLHTGVPRQPSYQQQQDDLIADIHNQLGSAIPVATAPSVVTRVFLPPVDTWENRTGCHFAFRCSVETTVRRTTFVLTRDESEVYYPGFFLDFDAQEDSGRTYDSAMWRIRADSDGDDYSAVPITKTGWWTLGMSFTPDGAVHYYATAGVAELRPGDHVATEFPFGYRCEGLRTFFFNVCNGDDGRTWSTDWIIDDPAVYHQPR